MKIENHDNLELFYAELFIAKHYYLKCFSVLKFYVDLTCFLK